MARLDNQLVNESVDKILAFARGETVDGVKGKARGFVETIELQVRVQGGGGHGERAWVAPDAASETLQHVDAAHAYDGDFKPVLLVLRCLLQISLRNYDPQKDKRFTGSFRLPVAPRPKLSVCVLGSEAHCAQARAIGVEAMVSATRWPRHDGPGGVGAEGPAALFRWV